MTTEHQQEQEHEGIRQRVTGALDRAQEKLDNLSRDPRDAAGVEAEAKRHREQLGEPEPDSPNAP